MLSTANLRRAVLGTMLAAGIALTGFSVHGLAGLDAQLSDAAERSAPAPALPVSDGREGAARDRDCPYRDRSRRGPANEA